MKVEVRNNQVDRALKTLKRKLNEDGMFRQLQEKMYYEKPSERRKRKHRASVVRQVKADKERAELNA